VTAVTVIQFFPATLSGKRGAELASLEAAVTAERLSGGDVDGCDFIVDLA
jgi:hypothetical protein